MKTNKIIGMGVIALLSLAPLMEAGKIGPLVDQASPSHSSGFGGWNLSNVDVKITDLEYNENADGKTYNVTDGSYSTMIIGDTFESQIKDTVSNTNFANLHGKDWPVGEPSGIKVIEEGPDYNSTLSHSRPANCIMTTSFMGTEYAEDGVTVINQNGYLDTTTPTESTCSGPFQSHKRFKLNLLPDMYIENGAYGERVNLTFNVKDDANTWRYMVLQKINNYTDYRLDGYKIEIGFLNESGVFTKATVAEVTDLKLSIGTGEDDEGANIWDDDDLATFSNGLFGTTDTHEHFLTDGFFDNTRAGYNISLTSADTIESNTTLGSNYVDLFGNWLPDQWAPLGIFYDDDDNPDTDAVVLAFWADYGLVTTGTATGDYAWLKGNDDNFAKANIDELVGWASDPKYEVGIIEDVLNLGLSYIVEIGDVKNFPTATDDGTGTVGTFTISIIPHFSESQDVPGFITNPPPAISDLIDEKGVLIVDPAPTFVIGEPLTLIVADDSPTILGNIDVNVKTSLGESETISLIKTTMTDPTTNADYEVFTAELPTVSGTVAGPDDDSITVTDATVVTITYQDADIDGAGTSGTVIVTTTAAVTPVTSTTTSSGGGSGAVNDNVSLLFTIFGFLLIGGLIVRRKLA